MPFSFHSTPFFLFLLPFLSTSNLIFFISSPPPMPKSPFKSKKTIPPHPQHHDNNIFQGLQQNTISNVAWNNVDDNFGPWQKVYPKALPMVKPKKQILTNQLTSRFLEKIKQNSSPLQLKRSMCEQGAKQKKRFNLPILRISLEIPKKGFNRNESEPLEQKYSLSLKESIFPTLRNKKSQSCGQLVVEKEKFSVQDRKRGKMKGLRKNFLNEGRIEENREVFQRYWQENHSRRN